MRSVSFGLAIGFLAALSAGVGACGGDEAKPQPVTPANPVVTTTPPPPVTEAPKEEPKPAPTMAELQKKTSEGMGMALNAHDAKKVASFYTENAVVKMAGMPDVTGRDAIAADWQKRFDASSDAKSMASRVFVKGDVVIVEWAWAGKQTGEMMGVKATEKPIGAAGAEVMWFSPDGLVKEQHTYVDMGTVMAQIGVSKMKARPVPTLPSGAPTVVVSTNTPEETKNVEAAAKMWAAFEKKSEADFLGATTDDITWDDMTQPETMKGKAAGKKFFAEMTKAFPDLKTTTANSWGVGDFVIAEGAMSGTHKGALMGIQPTKKQVNMHGLDIIQFNKDGKVIKGTSYGNGVEMMMQLGLMPQPGAAKDPKAPAAKADAKPAAAPAKTDAKPAAAPAKK
ncbi:MAG: hypothetical protein JWP87_4087 [Labilithrix sp.]|nr:hypothetical protein [Labilithrix sp.]